MKKRYLLALAPAFICALVSAEEITLLQPVFPDSKEHKHLEVVPSYNIVELKSNHKTNMSTSEVKHKKPSEKNMPIVLGVDGKILNISKDSKAE